MAEQTSQTRIKTDEIEQRIDEAVQMADTNRAALSADLAQLRRNKSKMLERERNRLQANLGKDHPLVVQLGQTVAMNNDLAQRLSVFADQARTAPPVSNADSWTLHGRVRRSDLNAMPGVIVALYDDKSQWLRQYGYVATDESGYFLLKVPIQTKTGGRVVTTEDAATAPPPTIQSEVFVQVTDSAGKTIYADKNALQPAGGQVEYVELIVSGDPVSSGPPDQGKNVDGPGTEPSKKSKR